MQNLASSNPIADSVPKVPAPAVAPLLPIAQQLAQQPNSGFSFNYDELGGIDVTGHNAIAVGDTGISVKVPVAYRHRRIWAAVYANIDTSNKFIRCTLKFNRNSSLVGTLPLMYTGQGNSNGGGNGNYRFMPSICGSALAQYKNASTFYGGTLNTTLCPNMLQIFANSTATFAGWDYLAPFSFNASFDEITCSIDDFSASLINARIFVACMSWGDNNSPQ